jgi:hypothetical protein
MSALVVAHVVEAWDVVFEEQRCPMPIRGTALRDSGR